MADEYGVAPAGFRLKTRDKIVSDMESAARGFFGDNVNLSSKSPLGLFIQLLSWPIALVWQALEGIYNSAYVDTATGQSLDNVAKYIGAERRAATCAVQLARFSGTKGTPVPGDFRVDTGGQNPIGFAVMTGGIMGDIGTVDLKIQCLQTGAVGNVAPGTISFIKNPASGINAVTNTRIVSEGLERETDQQFRERYKKSVAKGGASTLDSIMAALLEAPNVLDATVIENDTMTIDSTGRPPKSIEAIVLGGADGDIAGAIFKSKAAGIQAYGSITTDIRDHAGRTHQISFSRAQEVSIYVTIQVIANASYPADGATRLKDQVIAYIGGNDSANSYNRGLLMGEPVVYMQIPMAIDAPGIEDLVIQIGTNPNPNGTVNITIQSNQKAVTDTTKVVIN